MDIQSLQLILSFIVAFLVAFASTPVAQKIAFRIGAVDVPKDNRRMHKKPIPLLGGLAIFFGFLVGVLCFVTLTVEILGILAGSLIIVVLGIFDDKQPIRAIYKLLIQIAAALIVVLCGVKIEIFTNPNLFSPNDFLALGNLSIPITVVWIVAITNAYNLIDGLDGLAAGVSCISSICLLVVALIVSETNIALFTACIAGACFGFLPYNFNPAKIFMGDTGSTFLGFALACISIEGLFKGYAVISFAVPILILALPIFDTSIAILRRIKNKQPIMQPDRGHIHHKLIDMGFSQRQSVMILYGLALVLGLCAIILTGYGAFRAIALLGLAIVFILASAYFMKPKNNQNTPPEESTKEDDPEDE